MSTIGEVRWRDEVVVRGTVRSLRVRPWAGEVGALEVTLVDETGGIDAVFLGRTAIGGIRLGTEIEVQGRVGAHRSRLVLLNPIYRLLG
jgi:DNA/RNA endonuclease YhcR with UshA esterase domain